MSLDQLKATAGLSKSAPGAAAKATSKAAMKQAPARIMDFSGASSLAAGIKRVGGRGASVSRLGKSSNRGKGSAIKETKF